MCLQFYTHISQCRQSNSLAVWPSLKASGLSSTSMLAQWCSDPYWPMPHSHSPLRHHSHPNYHPHSHPHSHSHSHPHSHPHSISHSPLRPHSIPQSHPNSHPHSLLRPHSISRPHSNPDLHSPIHSRLTSPRCGVAIITSIVWGCGIIQPRNTIK